MVLHPYLEGLFVAIGDHFFYLFAEKKRYGEKRTYLRQIPAMTEFVKITGQIKKAVPREILLKEIKGSLEEMR